MTYAVEILDQNRNYKAVIRTLAPLDKSGMFLEYTSKLSDWGKCRFRVGTKDPLFTTEGDILQPYKNHVRIKRYGVVVWQGVIVNAPKRNKYFVEIEARTYLFLLSKILIKHDASVATGDGKDNYRTFSSGTLQTAVTSLITETIAKANSANALSSMTAGTIDSPSFPKNFYNSSNQPLTGAFTFSSDVTLQFDYKDVLYVLKNLGIYSLCDFELTNALVFNFRTYIGNKQPQMTFTYGPLGQIDDYNVPLQGDTMANVLTGIAVDFNNTVLHSTKNADDSGHPITTYGNIEGVAAYGDVKNASTLDVRITEELRYSSNPSGEIQLSLNQRAYPLGQYGVGDTVGVIIKDHIINVNEQRRIIQIDVKVNQTGKEEIRLVTNVPRDTQ